MFTSGSVPPTRSDSPLNCRNFSCFSWRTFCLRNRANISRPSVPNAPVPLACGELFTHPLEWDGLIRRRLIDFIRVHISMIGGITPALKLAAFAAASGVRTAWHGPGDLSPIGHAVNVHLDLSVENFGIQEWIGISDRLREVFPGSPELVEGFAYAPSGNGIGGGNR
jgi:L-alanine-DL-glutamate epimerase-like enolase superfamily enzyme